MCTDIQQHKHKTLIFNHINFSEKKRNKEERKNSISYDM